VNRGSEPFHLDACLDEQVFPYNNRATRDNPLTDADRFCLAVTQIVGKRLTYAQLTGKSAFTVIGVDVKENHGKDRQAAQRTQPMSSRCGLGQEKGKPHAGCSNLSPLCVECRLILNPLVLSWPTAKFGSLPPFFRTPKRAKMLPN
jgi:hypothetical protein